MLRPVWRLPSEPAWSAPGRRCCARFPVRWPAVRVVPGAPRAQLAYCGDGVAGHLHAIRDRLTGSALGIWSTGWRTPPRCERWPDVAEPRPPRVGAALGRTESSPTVASSNGRGAMSLQNRITSSIATTWRFRPHQGHTRVRSPGAPATRPAARHQHR